MAEHYREMSVTLPHPNGMSLDEANEKVTHWVTKWQDEGECAGDSYDWQERWGGVEIALTEEHAKEGTRKIAWLYGEDSANPEAAGNLIADYLDDLDFPPSTAIYFSWAAYCSKPMVNAALGGAAVISREGWHWINSYDVLDQAKTAGLEVINA